MIGLRWRSPRAPRRVAIGMGRGLKMLPFFLGSRYGGRMQEEKGKTRGGYLAWARK